MYVKYIRKPATKKPAVSVYIKTEFKAEKVVTDSENAELASVLASKIFNSSMKLRK